MTGIRQARGEQSFHECVFKHDLILFTSKGKSNATTDYTATRSEELQARYVPFIVSQV